MTTVWVAITEDGDPDDITVAETRAALVVALNRRFRGRTWSPIRHAEHCSYIGGYRDHPHDGSWIGFWVYRRKVHSESGQRAPVKGSHSLGSRFHA